MYSHFSQPHGITVYGLLFVAAGTVLWWLSRRNAERLGIAPSHIDLAVPIAIIGGIAGATAFGFLPMGDRAIAGADLVVDFRLRLFGLVVSAAVALFAYSRVANLRFRSLLDACALPTLAAVAVNRIGCFFAGCCWGDVSVVVAGLEGAIGAQVQTLPWLAGDWVAWAVTYEPGTWPYDQQLTAGLIGQGAAQSLPVHPVQLYEAGLLVIAYIVLRRVPLTIERPGLVAAAATLAYALLRFPLEFLRADGALIVANLTLVQVQIVALVMTTIIAIRVFSLRSTPPVITTKASNAR